MLVVVLHSLQRSLGWEVLKRGYVGNVVSKVRNSEFNKNIFALMTN